MEIKEHTRNQKRMYRIHKQEEKIKDLELLVGKLQQENKRLYNLNNTIFRELLDKRWENKKQKEVINKAIEYIKKHSFFIDETGYNKKIGYPTETYNAQEILDVLKAAR